MGRKKQSRRPGEGTVFQRKDGRWVCEITLEDHSRKQYYFKTEKEALEKRRAVLNELAQGVLATGCFCQVNHQPIFERNVSHLQREA